METENEKKWYKYNTEERIKNIYSKYNIKDFWNWWTNNENKVMEIRIKDFKVLKEYAATNNLNYSTSGVYVTNSLELNNIIKVLRDKVIMWFGVQSRRRNYNRYGKKGYGGGDAFVNSVDFLFVDIDRTIKENREATQEELMNCDIMANKILDKLSTVGWNKNYMKVCTGNGVQLIIKLDFSIMMPDLVFDARLKEFMYNNEFENIKKTIRKGIGDEIHRFTEYYSKDLNCKADTAAMLLSQVAALPFTKNYKYNGYTWRGIVELVQNGKNEGLTDYIMSKEVSEQKYRVFIQTKAKNLIHKGQISNDPLAKLLMEYDFPAGQINNTLWFSMKLLLRDSEYDLHSIEFKEFHNKIKQRHNRSFSLNVPEKKFSFNTNTVNNYCIDNTIPPIYPLFPEKNKLLNNISKNEIDFNLHKIEKIEMKLTKNNINEDLLNLKEKLKKGNKYNNILLSQFIKGCIKKYGEEKTKFYIKIELFNKLLNYE